jgi:hypothetical protein
LAPYLSDTGFTASWKGFLSAMVMTLTPAALIELCFLAELQDQSSCS